MSSDVPPLAPEQPFAAPAEPPAPKPRRTLPKWLPLAAGGVVVVVLIAALVVWAPWSPRPAAPASLTATSPTGTSVRLSWPAPRGGATPDHYVILRDDVRVAEVPASETSWTDTGLRPGEHFQYEVATRGGGRQSGPSRVATVTTLAPSPVGLKVAATYTTATLTWKPSPLGPAPDKYVVYNGPNQVATLDGSTTSYAAQGQLQGAAFQYAVVAEWGTVKSAPSAADFGTFRSAPLDTYENVNVTLTSLPSNATGATEGKAFPESWDFTPHCSVSTCTMTVDAALPGTKNMSYPYTVKVSPSGAGYTGSIKAHFVACVKTMTTDTLVVTLTPDKGDISNGAWGKWTGTVMITTPYTTLSDGTYCPSGNWDYSVSTQGKG
jgi:Fibronectin type III domain